MQQQERLSKSERRQSSANREQDNFEINTETSTVGNLNSRKHSHNNTADLSDDNEEMEEDEDLNNEND